jgi:hypothetical protein
MIEGYVDHEEGDRLARLAARVPGDQAIVEIGTASGSGLAYLAAGAREGNGARVFGVDPYHGEDTERDGRVLAADRAYQLARARLHYLRAEVTFIALPSEAAARMWPGIHGLSIGMLHVDGLHDYENVRADLLAWAPLMPSGGIIVCHDFFAPERIGEVARAVESVVVDGLIAPEAAHRWSRAKRRRGQWIGVKK